MGCNRTLALVLVVVVVGVLMVEDARAQVPDCASNLVPCVDYLNSTKPPESCCQPLRETIEKQRVCLCNLYNSPGLLKTLGINVTQALELPKYCGVSSDVSACNSTASAPTASVPPPGVPGSDDSSGASKMALTGISSLIFFWVSIMAY